MSLRDKLNNNPAAVTTGAVVLLLIAVSILVYVLFFKGGGRGTGTEQVIYYDVKNNTIKLVDRPGADPYPDSPLEGSPDVYMATIFACGECGEITDGMTAEQLKQNGMFIAYIHKRDPGTPFDPETNPTSMYRPLETSNWFPSAGDRWYPVLEKIQSRCPKGTYVDYCYAPYKR